MVLPRLLSITLVSEGAVGAAVDLPGRDRRCAGPVLAAIFRPESAAASASPPDRDGMCGTIRAGRVRSDLPGRPGPGTGGPDRRCAGRHGDAPRSGRRAAID